MQQPLEGEGAGDAEAHLELAIAFQEMGLIADSLEESARALQNSWQLRQRRKEQALAMLFDPRVLALPLDDTLGAIRRELSVN